MSTRYTFTAIFSLIAFLLHGNSFCNEVRIRVSGSSTAYPFISLVGEEFASKNFTKAPIVESIGTGGGFEVFCSKQSDSKPHFVTASRKIKESEIKKCSSNGITDIYELEFGYDAIVIIAPKGSKINNLSKKDLFYASSDTITKNGEMIKNNNKYWSEIRSDLPKEKIVIYGPPETSGTRTSFIELIILESCIKELNSAKSASTEITKLTCERLRSDGSFIDVGENDNLAVVKTSLSRSSLGILGFSYYIENSANIKSIAIDGVFPTSNTVMNRKYTVSRPLFIYFSKRDVLSNNLKKEFVKELLSDGAIGDGGYLEEIYLIPISKEKRLKIINDLGL